MALQRRARRHVGARLARRGGIHAWLLQIISEMTSTRPRTSPRPPNPLWDQEQTPQRQHSQQVPVEGRLLLVIAALFLGDA